MFPIQLQNLEGKKLTIRDCKSNSFVEDVKKSYSNVSGDPWERIDLHFKGRLLSENVRLDTIPNFKKDCIFIVCARSYAHPHPSKPVETQKILTPISKTKSGPLPLPHSTPPPIGESQQSSSRAGIDLTNRQLDFEEKKAAMQYELEKLKMQQEFELKKLEMQFKIEQQQKKH